MLGFIKTLFQYLFTPNKSWYQYVIVDNFSWTNIFPTVWICHQMRYVNIMAQIQINAK